MPARGMPDFTPHQKREQPRGKLEIWSEANWSRVPELVRKDVEGHLRAELEEHAPEVLAKWRDQHKRGVRIGSDDPMFHFGVGMSVRNACRDQLLDEELPAVASDPDGKPYPKHATMRIVGNWDDFYFGVLAAIAA